MTGSEVAAAALRNDLVKWKGAEYICVGYKRIIDKRKGIINSAVLKDKRGILYEVLIREVEFI